MPADRNELEVVDHDGCMALLAQHSVGRVGLSMGALPVVLPVNYVLDGDRIVIRTGWGTKLSAAIRNAVVCFEVDDIDRQHHSGWSVLVTGMARELTGAAAAEACELPLNTWAPSPGDHLVAIDIELLSGRRLGAVPVAVTLV